MTLAPKRAAMAGVSSTDPVSTTTISSTSRSIDSRHGPNIDASSRTMSAALRSGRIINPVDQVELTSSTSEAAKLTLGNGGRQSTVLPG